VARTVDGECVSGVFGRRKGDVRGLLKESGDGLYGVGVVDYLKLAESPWGIRESYHIGQ
jgi:hypothetical protein